MLALRDQEQRKFVLKVPNQNLPIALTTPLVTTPPTTRAMLERYIKSVKEKLGFALTLEDAARRIRDREERLKAQLLAAPTEEPAQARRPGARKPKSTQ